eukprot:3492990-Rhodomonas_salina.5
MAANATSGRGSYWLKVWKSAWRTRHSTSPARSTAKSATTVAQPFQLASPSRLGLVGSAEPLVMPEGREHSSVVRELELLVKWRADAAHVDVLARGLEEQREKRGAI